MEIRKLTKEERIEAGKISCFCFHMNFTPGENEANDTVYDTTDWGAFNEDGVIMAHMINKHLPLVLNKTVIQTGGIGGVSSLPEYRDSGAIRAIFNELLKDAYQNGEVISGLFPFKHAFYRKFGYETIPYCMKHTFSPRLLSGYRFSGTVKRYQAGDSMAPYLAVNEQFCKEFDLAAVRTEAMQERHFSDWEGKIRKFTYLLSENGKDLAYVSFRDQRTDGGALLKVDDYAFDGTAGLEALLGYLGRFTADYRKIELITPNGFDLLAVLQVPVSFEVESTPVDGYMVRVVNARELLTVMEKPADTDLILLIRDDIIAENNRTFRITGNAVSAVDAEPDVVMDIRPLAQLAIGGISPMNAVLRRDVQVLKNEAMFRRVFRVKPILINEHY